MLQKELRIVTLRNRFLGKPNKIEEEVDLRRQTKTKKIDNIGKLKEELTEWKFKSVKILQDLNHEKNDKIVKITKIELKLQRLGILKKSINFFKKLFLLKKHLHFVLQARK